ncbi:MAG: hypothetical protein J6Y20_04665 [Lachnospiraceae bacterium]|nr:hypothetical protein [Kiritimatiellia bacterium]MBP5461398.1 hypothetical protein [Lachnospiraceae bacterium]
MIRRDLDIGRWHVEFYFALDDYDIDEILGRLYFFGAGERVLRKARFLMRSGEPNQGFTFSNPYDRVSVVVVGPTTSGRQFQNTFTHELRHLINGIARSLGVVLDSETSSYMTGDAAMSLADVVCRLGCEKCRELL